MINALDDPREIRKLLMDVAFRDSRIDGNNVNYNAINAPASMVHHVMNMARARGYSGEDTMTVLAYHALLRYEDALDRLLNTTILTAPFVESCAALSNSSKPADGGSHTKEQ